MFVYILDKDFEIKVKSHTLDRVPSIISFTSCLQTGHLLTNVTLLEVYGLPIYHRKPPFKEWTFVKTQLQTPTDVHGVSETCDVVWFPCTMEYRPSRFYPPTIGFYQKGWTK